MNSTQANIKMDSQVTDDAINSTISFLHDETKITYYDLERMFDKLGNSLIHQKYGKITKRVAKYVKKHFSIELSSKCQSHIGKVLSESCGEREFHVVILPDISFRPGIFGDDDACFFKNTSHHSSHYRRVLQLMDASAVCFFEQGRPIARAWIIPDQENFVVINIYTAYGESLTLLQAASLLKTMLKKQYTHGAYWPNYNLYVNGNSAYVITDDCAKINELELDQPDCDADHDECISCRNCGEIEKAVMESLPEAEMVFNRWMNESGVSFGAGHPSYSPSKDIIRMPPKDSFDSAQQYYAVSFHEMVHSTGHESRMSRFVDKTFFGSETYSKEELIAEIGASFLCGTTGIAVDGLFDNQVSYIKGWLKALRDDPRMIVSAASKAQKAVDMILHQEVTA